MKTRTNSRGENTHSQPLTKSNNRWKWMAGATAATAAATSASQAETVQIDLINNLISTSTGSSINGDLTGDNTNELVVNTLFYRTNGGAGVGFSAGRVIGGLYLGGFASFLLGNERYTAGFFSPGGSFYDFGSSPVTKTMLFDIAFSDSSFNGGGITNGFLELRAINSSTTDHAVELVRLVFDDESTTAPTGVVAAGSDTVIGSVEDGVFTPATPPVTDVTIDIKPGSPQNTVNLGSQGVTKVAILSSETFDATQVDPLTVELADAEVRVKGNGTPQTTLQDVNGDGLLDLVLHMETEGFSLTEGDVSATLTGETFSGEAIEGTDLVNVVP